MILILYKITFCFSEIVSLPSGNVAGLAELGTGFHWRLGWRKSRCSLWGPLKKSHGKIHGEDMSKALLFYGQYPGYVPKYP